MANPNFLEADESLLEKSLKFVKNEVEEELDQLFKTGKEPKTEVLAPPRDYKIVTPKPENNMESPQEETMQAIEATFRPILSSNSQSPTHPSAKKIKKKSYRKKVESEWSHAVTLKLIQEIEVRHSLWDIGCPDYKLPKEMLWQEVGNATGMSISECKGKWSNLRTTFNSNLGKLRKKQSDLGATESISITWKYFRPMLFLESNKVLQSTQSTSSLKLDSGLDDVSFLENVEQDLQGSSAIACKDVNSTSLQSQINTTTIKQMAVEALQSIRSSVSRPKNASTALCEYMDYELNNLTPDQATFARSKLRRAFNDIMDEVAMMPFSQQQQSRVPQFDSDEMSSVANDPLDASEEYYKEEYCDENGQAIS